MESYSSLWQINHNYYSGWKRKRLGTLETLRQKATCKETTEICSKEASKPLSCDRANKGQVNCAKVSNRTKWLL